MKTYTTQQLLDPANAALVDEIVLVISLSFTDDANTNWLFVNHSRQSFLKALPKYIRMLVNLSFQCDASVTVITKDEISSPKSENSNKELEIPMPPNSTIRAVAITIPPHGNKMFNSTMAAIRAGLLNLPFKCGFGLTWRMITQFLPRFDRMHHEMFPDSATKYHNYHLFYLATHPDCRGQGVGKRMLIALQETVRELNNIEEEKAKLRGKKFVPAPFYLEASNSNNRRLYSRVGFEDRSMMTYGAIGDDENVRMGKDGRTVIGGRMFGMVWMP